jgi:hypothetical protein
LTNDLALLSRDPFNWVLYAFEWGSGELKDFKGPDKWQAEILQAVSKGLLTPQQAILIAISSGHGPGKSALVAWLILWSLSTFPDTKGVVTANTETQLKTKTWAELAKWHNLCIIKKYFILTATALYSADPNHERTWRVDQIPWSENKTEAFAGLHNQGKRVLVVFDEASAIPDKIWEVTEGALTDQGTEIIWLVCGNPTRNTGRFHQCFGSLKHRWLTKHVDSREALMTNKEQIAKWISDYGEDSDFVRVRVRGVFPNVSDRQFIPSSYVEQARGKHLREDQYNFAAKVIGVDPAWSGEDETVIVLRQGNASKILGRYRKIEDDFVVAGYVADFEDREKADAVFIDLGWGTGIKSAGNQLKRNWVLVPFGGHSNNPGFKNKRSDMWNEMKQWLRNGGAIQNDPEWCAQLTGPEYYVVPTGPDAGKTILESKKDMKARGLASPNIADALALTFASPVAARFRPDGFPYQMKPEFTKSHADYDPLAV